jgi:hypothetical protein
MKWLKKLLGLMGVLAGTAMLLVMVAGLFIFALQDPVEMKSANVLTKAQEPLRTPEQVEDRRVVKL